MKKIIISLITVLALFSFSAVAQITWPPEDMNGDGLSAETAWEITTPEHLKTLADYVNSSNGNAANTDGKYYKLMNDLDLSAYSAGDGWQPIGGTYSFQGNFDGNGKRVRNLIINRPTEDCIGLFGHVQSMGNGAIENLGMEDCNITGQSYVGGLVGRFDYDAVMTNCYVSGSVSGNQYVGGLVGWNDRRATITNCYTIGTINGANNYIGGLVGYNESSTISASFSAANVVGARSVGGLVGYNNYIITNCYATGNVIGNGSGDVNVGGLVGWNWGIFPSITYCYATGNVSGTGNCVGGLVGHNSQDGTIQNCVAANNSVIATGTVASVTNRVLGWSSNGWMNNVLNNYANSNMVVQANGVTLNVGSNINGRQGADVDVATLQSLVFYTTVDNWADEIWDFTIWNICDGETLPWLRWENIDCGDLFVAVTNITGVPTAAMASVPLTLTATVLPYNATNTSIVWSISNDGGTGATLVANILDAPTQGTVEITATIIDGLAEGLSYIQNFTIEVGEGFVPVADITNVPAEATVGIPLTLTVAVLPANASFQTISWSVTCAGTTGATITVGNIFNATTEGMAVVKATIANGISMGTPFTKEFSIVVKLLSITEINAAAITVYPNPTSGQLRIASSELRMEDVHIYDVMGKKILTSPMSQSSLETTMDVTHLPNGVYFLRIQTDQGLVTKKVIKH